MHLYKVAQKPRVNSTYNMRLYHLYAKSMNVYFFPLILNGNVTFTHGLEKIAAKFWT